METERLMFHEFGVPADRLDEMDLDWVNHRIEAMNLIRRRDAPSHPPVPPES